MNVSTVFVEGGIVPVKMNPSYIMCSEEEEEEEE